MAARPDKTMARVLRDHRKWLADAADIVPREMGYLERNLSDRSLQSLVSVADSLRTLGTYYGTLGITGIIDGNMEEWDNVHRAASYHFWAVKIFAMAHYKTAFLGAGSAAELTNSTSICACLVCYGIINDLSEQRMFAVDVLNQFALESRTTANSFWAERVFEPFVLWLNSQLEPGNLPEGVAPDALGPYGRILKNWADGKAIGEAIREVCDYHCRNMEDHGRDWDPEFKDSPFDLYPVEVLAIYKVRRDVGVNTEVTNHPLMSTPLASTEPRKRSANYDGIIDRVRDSYRRLFA